MRMVLIGIVAAVVAVAMNAESASAGKRRVAGPPEWCNQGNSVNGGIMECSYHTLQQCLVSARGVGGGCIPNPWYEWQALYRRQGSHY